jgi:hypothetical protein
MNKNMKMILGLGLVLAMLSSTFITIPLLANTNGTSYSNEETSTIEDCNGEMLQTRNRDRVRIQNQNGECEGQQSQTRNNHRAENRNGKNNN